MYKEAKETEQKRMHIAEEKKRNRARDASIFEMKDYLDWVEGKGLWSTSAKGPSPYRFNLGDNGRKKMRDLYSKRESSSSIAPSCQVESCDSDLSEAKHCHRRSKVCEFHAKAPSVLIAGVHQRFCQQCNRQFTKP
ncbi:squamosa promoter-binding protein 1-like [Prosopis cineraria]|uniref:squamosa promoter-binding protein 1-like n=1 Tax=Prosopis cineraria TaxID=364024 RepID=UPI00240FDE67|nr:squamosa promoter-binding protein 1-like [Prosopis cineraria]